ncbi:MAG: transposase [Bacteroidota bacterium]
MAELHKTRKSIRIKGYDYSKPGHYFITICTENRSCLFGNVHNRQMVLNDMGGMIGKVWNELPEHYPYVALDAFVIMPNHVHGIIVLRPDPIVGAGLKPARTKPARTKPARTIKRHALPEIVRGLKTFSSRRINEIRNTPGVKLWQRNYYEHIIRNENELYKIRKYIQENPLKWETDKENPKHINIL